MKKHSCDPDDYAGSARSAIHKATEKIKGFWSWAKHRITHKLDHIRPTNLLDVLAKHGLALMVIIVAWEIIEDVLFPLLFIWMGNNIHPVFLVGAPAAWLICLHWLMVPLTWSMWIKLKEKTRRR